MDRDFERFRGGPNEPLAERVYVTISKTRNIVFNRNCYERLGRPAAVHLYYSHKRDEIGIETTSPRFDNAFPVMPNGAGYRISASPFCQHFNIQPPATLKFVAPQFNGRSVRLKLGETVTIARSARKKKK